MRPEAYTDLRYSVGTSQPQDLVFNQGVSNTIISLDKWFFPVCLGQKIGRDFCF